MKLVNIGDAKAHLSAYIKRVENGEVIFLARRNSPVIELRRVGPKKLSKRRPIGLAKGDFKVPSDFDDPLPSDILDGFLGK